MIELKVKVAKGLWEKSVGLIGKKPYPLLFKTRFGIHTFGMREPIDIVVLDQRNRVKKYKKNLQPNSVLFWNPKFDTVIELPRGTIKATVIGPDSLIDIKTYA